jgi:hypothetical protein
MIKKLILTVIVTTFLGAGAYAQVSGGLKLGANFANQKIYSDFNVTLQNRTSFHAGFYATITISESLGLQPELMYSSIGSKFEVGGAGSIVNKIDYLTMPLLLRYNPVPIFNIHGGPQFGFRLSAKVGSDGDYGDNKENIYASEMAMAIGAGVDLPMGLGFSARYVFGLSNVAKTDNGDTMRNKVIQLSMMYKLFGDD